MVWVIKVAGIVSEIIFTERDPYAIFKIVTIVNYFYDQSTANEPVYLFRVPNNAEIAIKFADFLFLYLMVRLLIVPSMCKVVHKFSVY